MLYVAALTIMFLLNFVSGDDGDLVQLLLKEF